MVLADGTVVGGPVRLGVGLGDGGQGDRVDARGRRKLKKKKTSTFGVGFKKPPVEKFQKTTGLYKKH
jgi:hypothetical protein